MPRFILRALPARAKKIAQQCRRSAPTADQAAGGARERKATRRGSTMPRAALNDGSMRQDTSGTGSFGGSDTNDVETRKIEAQIAQ